MFAISMCTAEACDWSLSNCSDEVS